MKRIILAVIIGGMGFPGLAQDEKRKPDNLTMTLASLSDAEHPLQYLFIINGVVAFKTVEGLEKYLMGLPKGLTLTWAPGCCRMGNQPLLSSQEEMKKFEEFCKSIGAKFVLVPSG